MELRKRQKVAVENCVSALNEYGNTLLVAPTGSGKTVMMAAVASEITGPKIVLQHRDELVDQNRRTFRQVNGKQSTELFTADHKKWARDGVTFAMVQTLIRNLDDMPPVVAIEIDEAHHTAADSYLRIIDKAQKLNPDVMLFGVSATPNRGDKRALRGVFDNVADQISLRELIDTGFLVKPRVFVIDIGTQDALKGVRKTASDFDMGEVEKIMDKGVLNERIVEEWKKLAGERQTVVFASTVAHAAHVADAFCAAGVAASLVHGEMPDGDRRAALADFDAGKTQVVVNVAVLTEGWDCQPVSCVVLLRPSSYKSTMVQMIGRGLRKIDPERYPGQKKDDCIVIDFGTSALIHGAIEDEVLLDGKGGLIVCPSCQAHVPAACPHCPLCRFEFPKQNVSCETSGGGTAKERDILEHFALTEVELLEQSPYKWEPIFDGSVMVATAFDAWAMNINYGDRWHALGGNRTDGVRLLADAEDRTVALASADDYLREHGDSGNAHKTRWWLTQPPTDKQTELLGITPMQALVHGMTRYKAACHLTWRFNEKRVRQRLEGRMLAA